MTEHFNPVSMSLSNILLTTL